MVSVATVRHDRFSCVREIFFRKFPGYRITQKPSLESMATRENVWENSPIDFCRYLRTKTCPEWRPAAVSPRPTPSRPSLWTRRTARPRTWCASCPPWSCSPPAPGPPWSSTDPGRSSSSSKWSSQAAAAADGRSSSSSVTKNRATGLDWPFPRLTRYHITPRALWVVCSFWKSGFSCH